MKRLQHQYSELTVKTQLHLFDTLVLPVLNYGSEIWGFSDADKLETFYLGFLKNTLSVRISTPSAFIYKELNVLPLKTYRLIRIFKFWLKIIHLPDSSLVKRVYNLMISDMESTHNISNWVSLLKNMLNEYGFGYLWNQQNLLNKDETFIISLFKQRIYDVFLQNNNADLHNVSNTRLYKHINVHHVNNSYLDSIKEKYIRTALTKLRLGSHNFLIERGRWVKLEIVDRQCLTCGKLDDELHVLTECKLFTNWRSSFLPNWLYNKPSMYKLISFLDTVKDNELRKLGIFCHKVFDYILKNIV